MKKGQERLSSLQEKISVAKKEAATFAKIEGMAKKTIGGNIQLSPDNWKCASTLAREGVKSWGIIAKLKERINELLRKISGLERRLKQHEGQGITDTMRYYQAQQRTPRRISEVIADHAPASRKERTGTRVPKRKQNTDMEL